jgi:hypothetical protein
MIVHSYTMQTTFSLLYMRISLGIITSNGMQSRLSSIDDIYLVRAPSRTFHVKPFFSSQVLDVVGVFEKHDPRSR